MEAAAISPCAVLGGTPLYWYVLPSLNAIARVPFSYPIAEMELESTGNICISHHLLVASLHQPPLGGFLVERGKMEDELIVRNTSCAMCRFSVKIEGDPSDYLECRRHAIQIAGIDGDGDAVSAFPVCEPGMWCGEHEIMRVLDLEDLSFDGLKVGTKPRKGKQTALPAS